MISGKPLSAKFDQGQRIPLLISFLKMMDSRILGIASKGFLFSHLYYDSNLELHKSAGGDIGLQM